MKTWLIAVAFVCLASLLSAEDLQPIQSPFFTVLVGDDKVNAEEIGWTLRLNPKATSPVFYAWNDDQEVPSWYLANKEVASVDLCVIGTGRLKLKVSSRTVGMTYLVVTYPSPNGAYESWLKVIVVDK